MDSCQEVESVAPNADSNPSSWGFPKIGDPSIVP